MSWQWCHRSGITNVNFDLNPDIYDYVDLKKLEKVKIVLTCLPPNGIGKGQVIEIKSLSNTENFLWKPKYFNATPNIIDEIR